MNATPNPDQNNTPMQILRYNVLTMVNRADLITEIAARNPGLDFLLESTNAIRDSLSLDEQVDPEHLSTDPDHYRNLITKLSDHRIRIQENHNLNDKTPLLEHLTNCIHATMTIIEVLQDNPGI